jgi:O-antigen ligase
MKQVQDDNQSSIWNINQSKLLSFFIFIQIIGLILTFSKSAILGFIIALAFICFKQKDNVPRFIHKMFRVEHNLQSGTLAKKVIIIFLIILLAFFLIKPDIYSFFIKSLGEREIYLQVALSMIATHPLVGIGSGQFVLEMQKYSKIILEIWQHQPVHNVFLLIWAELGILGLFIFLCFLWKLIRHNLKQKRSMWNIYMSAILFSFIFIMLFDHYFWDIQQGQIMLWMVMGLIAGSIKCHSDPPAGGRGI